MHNLVFIHQNFPGQFIHLVKHFVGRHDVRLFGIGMADNVRTPSQKNLTVLTYPKPAPPTPEVHHYVHFFEQAVRYGQAVVRHLLALKEEGVTPDVIVAHPAWGEALFIRDVFPHTAVLLYNEFFDAVPSPVLNFDPEFPDSFDKYLEARARSAVQLISQEQGSAGISPTYWQRGLFPAFVQSKTRVVFDGIDTEVVKPVAGRRFLEIDGVTMSSDQEVITYVSRNLEPHRGFHRFMRALPAIQRARPQAHVVVVGNDQVSYSNRPAKHPHWRAAMLAEHGAALDLSRLHFLPKLDYQRYVGVLQLSQLHIYLTYPSVLSWSMVEAMAAGCLVVGANVPPIAEVIEDGVNGLLVDYFDTNALVTAVNRVFDDPDRMAGLRQAARQTVLTRYDLKAVCLPQQIDFLRRWLPGL